VAPKGRHTRSTPHLPLVAPEADPEKIIKKGKASQGASSSIFSGTVGNLPDSTFQTPVVVSSISKLPTVEASVNLKLGEFPVEYSSFSPQLKEESLENFDVLASPEVVNWFRLESLEDFPLLGSPSPHSFKFVVTKEEGTSVPLEFSPSTSKTQPLFVKLETPPSYTLPFPKIPDIHIATFPIKSPPTSPRIQNPPFPNQMAGANPPQNRMDAIVATRYAPLVLPQPMNSLPIGYYLKYMPKFTGEEDITAEEHLATFYSYVDNLNIENEDVWMRVFVQSLDGEARKWFRSLSPGSIVGIEALDDAFLRHWGDKKDFCIISLNLVLSKEKKVNQYQTFPKGSTKCIIKSLLKSSLLKLLPK
jgi:hypothetical protein